MTRSEPWPRAMLDGRVVPLADARLPITDSGLAHGDGAFETVGVWDGVPFALEAHLERLAASLRGILLPEPDLELLRGETDRLLEGVTGDATLRLYVTASGTRLLTLDDQQRRERPAHLLPYPAPWIRPKSSFGPAGAKTMSYLPHRIATRAARAAGADDALLVTEDGVVLEGPTFAVYWAAGGALHAPSLDLGVIDSISRRAVLAAAVGAGIEVVTGSFTLDDLAGADEMMVSSALRDVLAVTRVGDLRFGGPGPVRQRLSERLTAARRSGATTGGAQPR